MSVDNFPKVTATGGGKWSRIPALFAIKIDNKVKLAFRTKLNSNTNYGFDFLAEKFTWMSIQISEIDGQYEIIIDGQIVHSAVNNSTSEWESVEVDIADTRDGDKPTAGQYQNFVYNLCYFSWENSALTDNGVITVSSNYGTGSNKNKITDGLSNTYWHSADQSPWMKFAMNTPQTIIGVTIGIRPGK